jgi:hypothetical protein
LCYVFFMVFSELQINTARKLEPHTETHTGHLNSDAFLGNSSVPCTPASTWCPSSQSAGESFADTASANSAAASGPSSARYPSSPAARASRIVCGPSFGQQLFGLLATILLFSLVSSSRRIVCGHVFGQQTCGLRANLDSGCLACPSSAFRRSGGGGGTRRRHRARHGRKQLLLLPRSQPPGQDYQGHKAAAYYPRTRCSSGRGTVLGHGSGQLLGGLRAIIDSPSLVSSSTRIVRG